MQFDELVTPSLSASFFGIGGECGAVDIAWLVSVLVGDVVSANRGTCKDTLGLGLAVITAAGNCWGAEAENVLMLSRAVAIGMVPRVT